METLLKDTPEVRALGQLAISCCNAAMFCVYLTFANFVSAYSITNKRLQKLKHIDLLGWLLVGGVIMNERYLTVIVSITYNICKITGGGAKIAKHTAPNCKQST